MSIARLAVCAVFVLSTALVSSAALAQFPGGGGRGGGMGRDGTRNDQRTPRDGQQRPDRASPGATTQAQLDAMEDDLKLNETQRPLWYAYADQVQKLGDTMSRLRFEARTGHGNTGGTTPEQLDRIADDERRRATTVEQIASAAKVLYATLTAEQKRIADARFAMPVMDLTFGALSTRGGEEIGGPGGMGGAGGFGNGSSRGRR